MRVARTVIFILICIGLLWLAVLLISRAVSGIFGSDTEEDVRPVASLVTYATSGAITELYIDGPVIANQEHKAFRISVDRSQVKAERITGYEGQVVIQEVFPNSEASYAAFLSSLEKLGFTPGVPDDTDDRGHCPFGNRYIFTINDNGEDIMHAWTTSCGGGTYLGNRGSARSLFLKQVPQKPLTEMSRNFSL